MSVAKDDGELVLALALLARNAPATWSIVVAELKKRVDRTTDQLVSATDQVSVHQGRARECAALLKLAENCVKEAEEIMVARQRAQPKRPQVT